MIIVSKIQEKSKNSFVSRRQLPNDLLCFFRLIFYLYVKKGTIFHVYQAPVVVTLLVGMNANLGAVRSTAIPLLKEVLEPLCATLLNSLAPAQTDHAYPQQGYYQ